VLGVDDRRPPARFPLSLAGHDRASANLWMLGDVLRGLSLPSAALPVPAPSIDSPSPPAAVSNVVPLRAPQNADRRLH